MYVLCMYLPKASRDNSATHLPTNTHHNRDDFYRPATATRRLLGLGLRTGAASKAPEALGGFGTPAAPEPLPRSIRGPAAHGQRRRSRAPRRPQARHPARAGELADSCVCRVYVTTTARHCAQGI
jgi:hypothetical protein